MSELEIAAQKYAEGKSSSDVFRQAHIKDFISGAEWYKEHLSKTSKDIVIDEIKKALIKCAINEMSEKAKNSICPIFKFALFVKSRIVLLTFDRGRLTVIEGLGNEKIRPEEIYPYL